MSQAMSGVVRFVRMLSRAVLTSAVLALAVGACSSDDPILISGPDSFIDTLTFHGVMAGSGGDTGTLALVLDARPAQGSPTVFDVSAVFIFGATRVHATGIYDVATNQIDVAGGGCTLTGDLTHWRFGGTYTRANPNRTGSFMTMPFDQSAPVPYLGTWAGNGMLGADSGSVCFLMREGLIHGVARNEDGTTGVVRGEYVPGSGDIAMTYPTYVFTGDVTVTNAAGLYSSTLDGGRSGNWTATASGY